MKLQGCDVTKFDSLFNSTHLYCTPPQFVFTLENIFFKIDGSSWIISTYPGFDICTDVHLCQPVSQGKAAELEDGLKQLSDVSTELEEVKGMVPSWHEKWSCHEMWGRITMFYRSSDDFWSRFSWCKYDLHILLDIDWWLCQCLFFKCVIFLQLHDTWSHYASNTYSANPNSEGR